MSEPAEQREEEAGEGGYRSYVLGVLVVVYVLNFLDRQIPSILAEEIKRDLQLSDSQIGFLYGTAFAVFYAIFGIPLGRLADAWSRRSLIAMGLVFWSAMTAASGLARNFTQLAIARVGVGVGEASATPAAYSMLSDYFPPARRASVLAIYSSGIYIGGGLGLMIGGGIVERWNAAYAGGGAPFGLEGWQAAFLAVGLPGIFVAAWVRTLREPARGALDRPDGRATPSEPHPFRAFFRELRAVLPPFTLWNVWAETGSPKQVARNCVFAAIAVAGGVLLSRWTGDAAQWGALSLGLYATASWMQVLRFRDPPTAALILGTPSLAWASLGFAFLAFTGYGFGFWGAAPYFVRTFDVDLEQLGLILGGAGALGGFLGVTAGGWLADRLRRRGPNGRLWVGVLTSALSVPIGLLLVATPDLWLAYGLSFAFSVASSTWLGAGAATIQDLVLPRMRAIASAFYILWLTFIGLALGPYLIGQMSDAFGDLRLALRWSLVANAISVVCLLLAARHLPRDHTQVESRARAAGESPE